MTCPFCTSQDLERIGAVWFCRCCSKEWPERSGAGAVASATEVIGHRSGQTYPYA